MTEMVGYKIIPGDCRESLKGLPSRSVNSCVTSPPYFGLRDYGVEGQIGLEERAPVFIESLVNVFQEVFRVLKDDGTLFVNIGDSYSTHGDGKMVPQSQANGNFRGLPYKAPQKTKQLLELDGYKNKELMGIPWSFALAMRNVGWLLRQEIIWAKPNYTPECVRDRFVKSHEHIFMFTKNSQYWFDGDAVRIPNQDGTELKLRSDVWSVPVTKYKGSHNATFPPALIEPCIIAGCPPGGTVLDPFGGTGTTAGVSLVHGRNSIICELNPESVNEIKPRVQDVVDSCMVWSEYPDRIKKNIQNISDVRRTKRLW